MVQMGFRQGLDGVQIGFRCCYCCNQNVVVVVAAVVFVAAVVVVDAVMVAVMVAVLVFVCVLCSPFFYCIDAFQHALSATMHCEAVWNK